MSLQVEGTNDSSCLSKYSAVQRGYFDDSFLSNFVNKCPRRAPLINLGYSVRAVIINSVVQEFVKINKNPKQIVSFGAGFDTTFFKLKKQAFADDVFYYELDLPRVVERKIKCIQRASDLTTIVGRFTECEDGLVSEHYKLLSVDLRDLSKVEGLFRKYGLDPSLPTMFLSECAITYLEEQSSSALIRLASMFEHATFVTYEQIHPDDGFGLVMTHHFSCLQSPLLSVWTYPTLLHQNLRYLQHQWEHCTSVSALNAYNAVTSTADRSKVLRLEPFDEWEEFYLKCNHYALVIASKGCLSNWSKLSQQESVHTHLKAPFQWELVAAQWLPRYGHSVVPYKNKLLLVGGFGVRKDGTHGRMKDILFLKLEDSQWVVDRETEDDKFSSMYMSCTQVSDKNFVVYGGRFAPTKCVNESPQLVTVEDKDVVKLVTELVVGAFDQPARWRHSAVAANRSNILTLVVFGGRTSELELLADTWMISLEPLSVNERQVTVLSGSSRQPCPRFSHSAAVRQKDSGSEEMWLSGGLGSSGPLSDVWCLDLGSLVWQRLSVSGMVARFGHSSSVLNHSLIMVGGVNDLDGSQPGVGVVDLMTGVYVEYRLPVLSPDRSMLLIGHCHVISSDQRVLYIIGGGGNCFSFGTSFNKHYAVVKLSDLNL